MNLKSESTEILAFLAKMRSSSSKPKPMRRCSTTSNTFLHNLCIQWRRATAKTATTTTTTTIKWHQVQFTHLVRTTNFAHIPVRMRSRIEKSGPSASCEQCEFEVFSNNNTRKVTLSVVVPRTSASAAAASVRQTVLNKTRVLLHFLDNFVVKRTCSLDLHVCVYWMDVSKRLDSSHHEKVEDAPMMMMMQHTYDDANVIGEEHANTAFTYACNVKNEITIYRSQEWFKVLIHECFHALGLDFAYDTLEKSPRSQIQMRALFDDVTLENPNVWETYAEIWAVIINCVAVADAESSKLATMFANEALFSQFQVAKILRHNGFQSYLQVIGDDDDDDGGGVKKHRYREDTSVFAYYVFKSILLFHLDAFLVWCKDTNSTNGVFFDAPIESFVRFFKDHMNTPSFVQNMQMLMKSSSSSSSSTSTFLKTTMRMTVYETVVEVSFTSSSKKKSLSQPPQPQQPPQTSERSLLPRRRKRMMTSKKKKPMSGKGKGDGGGGGSGGVGKLGTMSGDMAGRAVSRMGRRRRRMTTTTTKKTTTKKMVVTRVLSQ